MANGEQGRPTKYKKEYDKQVFQLCLLGAKDTEIARFFGVNEDTFYEWKKVHESFSEAIQDGKERADMQVVNKMFDRVMGYEYEEEQAFNNKGEIIKTTVKKKLPPDTKLLQFWLKNRQGKRWREKQEIEATVNTKVNPMEELSIEELKRLAEEEK